MKAFYITQRGMRIFQKDTKMTEKLLPKAHTEKQSSLLPYFVAKQLHHGARSQVFMQCSDWRRLKEVYISFATMLQSHYQEVFKLRGDHCDIPKCPHEGCVMSALSWAYFLKPHANTWAQPTQVQGGWTFLIWECFSATVQDREHMVNHTDH